MIRTAFLTFLAVFTAAGASLKTDIEYAKVDGESLKMDASIPDGKGPFPTVILLHGGGWQSGDKAFNFKQIFAPLSQAGFAWFSVNYRLAPKYRYPACIDDVVLAIKYVEAHAKEYNVDPTKIALSGESAGGHIVAYIGARYARELHIAAVVPFYPATDFVAMVEGPDKNQTAYHGVTQFVGVTEINDEARKRLRDASPITYVHKGMPPYLFVHGTADQLAYFHQSQEMCDKMKQAGSSCEIYALKGAPHWLARWENHPEWEGYKQKVTQWLNQVMHVVPSADFFVAPNGKDSWSGKLAAPNAAKSDGPFASVAKAQSAVRALAGKRPLTVMVRGGTYYLPLSPTEPGTLKFSSSDSGTASMPITWMNYPGETPVISGGVPLGKTWKKVSGNLWRIELPASTPVFGYLFYNGERRLRSRVQSSTGTGYYMQGGSCYSTVTKQVVDISQCNLGAFLRIKATISPNDPDGAGCPGITNPQNREQAKCLDRFYYAPDAPVAAWANLKPVDSPWHKCALASGASYPEGDIEVTIFNSWTLDAMRVSCVDSAKHILYFTGKTEMVSGGAGDTYHAFGPWPNHRFMVENTKDAFVSAQTAGQTGQWFLDRSSSPWALNYLANRGEDPNTDTVVIARVPPVSRLGGSLMSAADLRYVTFHGITFEVDNYIPPPQGFNEDQNTEFTLPTALDCESCQNVTFDGINVRHTSTTGLVITSRSNNSGEPAKNDVIQNSAFYDIGDSGIRIGRGATRFDKPENVVQSVTVQNNIIQGYSRVFPDGEGIALSSGHDIQFIHNDIGDGYHTAIAVCFFGCVAGVHTANGNNILSSYNHIWDSMQGITSDGGTLYYNVGDSGGSGTGNKILNNLVHDTTSAEIIDGFPTGYGGRGIYLDNQTAGVLVENNVVYNMSQDVAWMSRGPAPGQPGNIFNNNILAYGRRAIFHGAEWPAGCKDPSLRVSLTNNIFYFDRENSQGFDVTQGCAYTCGLPYNKFINYQGNLYWRTDGKFAQDPKGFHIVTNEPENARKCGRDYTFLTFAQWQSSQQPVRWGPPGGMNLDTTGTATVNPNFGNTGKPTDFLLKKNPMPGFDYTKTNDTIRNAGRQNPTFTPPRVPHTFPVYAYTRADF